MLDGQVLRGRRDSEGSSRSEEQIFDEKIRDIMNEHRMTYQEAEKMLKSGQKMLFGFR